MSDTHTLDKEKKQSGKTQKEYCLIPIENYDRASDKRLAIVTKKFTRIEDVMKELETDHEILPVLLLQKSDIVEVVKSCPFYCCKKVI